MERIQLGSGFFQLSVCSPQGLSRLIQPLCDLIPARFGIRGFAEMLTEFLCGCFDGNRYQIYGGNFKDGASAAFKTVAIALHACHSALAIIALA